MAKLKNPVRQAVDDEATKRTCATLRRPNKQDAAEEKAWQQAYARECKRLARRRRLRVVL